MTQEERVARINALAAKAQGGRADPGGAGGAGAAAPGLSGGVPRRTHPAAGSHLGGGTGRNPAETGSKTKRYKK